MSRKHQSHERREPIVDGCGRGIDLSILPRTSGVCRICCSATGKIYVGSTVNLRERWYRHRWRLRSGSHCNSHLRQAWNRYGEGRFEITVLELVDAPDLLRAEQEWIDRTRSWDRKIGFNLYKTAGSPGDRYARIWTGFIDPSGNDVTITNLHEYCREEGLDYPSMHRLAMGRSKLKSYKGWTHKNSPRLREYVKVYDGFVNPAGQRVDSITNLAAFCRPRGLDPTHMVAVAHGRILSHKGWTLALSRPRAGGPKTYTGFVNPQGEQVTISNLKAFCDEHGLCGPAMHGLKAGKRKSHRGWTWKEDFRGTRQRPGT
jgi:group I intron endonuclease